MFGQLGLGLGLGGSVGGVTVSIPALAPTFPINQFDVKKSGKRYSIAIPYDDYRPSGTTMYYSKYTGNDTTGDGSESTPYATPAKCITEGASIVLGDANGGTAIYGYNDTGWNTTQPTLARDTEFGVYNGNRVILSAAGTWDFSKTTGRTNVYEATVGLTGRIVDYQNLGSDGYPIALEFVADIATCDSTPNSYFYDDSNVLYVHTFDSRAVTGTDFEDHGILAFRAQNNRYTFNFAGNFDFYSNQVSYWGGEYPFARRTTSAAGKSTILKNGSVLFAGTASVGVGTHTMIDRVGISIGTSAVDAGLTVLDNMTSAYHGLDGSAYLAPADTQQQVIEVNCNLYENINTESANNNIVNGSSSHDSIPILRLNGEYYRNAGRNIGDTNAGTFSLNLGCTVGESLTATQEGTADACMGVTDGAIMYAYDCTLSDSFYGFYQSGSTSIIGTGNVDNVGNNAAGVVDIADTAIPALGENWGLEVDFSLPASYVGSGASVYSLDRDLFNLVDSPAFSSGVLTFSTGDYIIADTANPEIIEGMHKTGAINGYWFIGSTPAGSANTYWGNTASGSAGHGWQAINTGTEVLTMRQAGGSGWNANSDVTLPEAARFMVVYQWNQTTNSFDYFVYTGSGTIEFTNDTLTMSPTTTAATALFSIFSLATSTTNTLRSGSTLEGFGFIDGNINDQQLAALVAAKY